MQRFLNNLLAAAVIGLLSTSASLAMAHGGGGHSSGGHSAGGRSGGSHSFSGHSLSGHNAGVRRTGGSHIGGSHVPLAHLVHPTAPGHFKGTHYPNHLVLLEGNGNIPGTIGGNIPPYQFPVRYPHPPRHRWPYHMCYPVGFWFGGSYAVAGADMADGGIDVEFTKIEQLDAGDPAKNLAPAYRVWLHNNCDVDIAQPFDVAILASTDEKLSQSLPYASVRMDSLAADETASVDIRLPIAAMSMGSADGQTAAYTYVHTIIDSQNELVETNKANNLSVDSRDAIPAAAE